MAGGSVFARQMGYQKNAFLGAASLSTTIHSCTSVTIVTRHNDIVSVLVQRKQHPPLKARRVARIGGSLFAVAALCLFLSCFRFTPVLFCKTSTYSNSGGQHRALYNRNCPPSCRTSRPIEVPNKNLQISGF